MPPSQRFALDQESKPSIFEQFGGAVFDSAIQRPVNALSQLGERLSGKDLPEMNLVQLAQPTSGTEAFAQQAGSAVGMIVPFLGARYVARGALKPVLGNSIKSLALEGAGTGFIFGFGLTPTGNNESFWSARLANGFADAGTFAVLNATAGKLAQSTPLRLSAADDLGLRMLKGSGIGAVSGLPAGFTSAELHSLFHGNGLVGPSQFAPVMRDFAIFGGLLGGFDGARARIPAPAIEPAKTTGEPAVQSRFTETAIGAELPAALRVAEPTAQVKAEAARANEPVVPATSEKVLSFNPRERVGSGDEGTVYSNGDGTVTKVYFDKTRDMEAVRAMYERLEGLGIKLPKILETGKTADGQPAIRMEQIGDGDNLSFQFITGEISRLDRVRVAEQYYALADTINNAGIRIDWNLKNMRWENGELYILDPSFLKEEPMGQGIVDHYGRGIGPRP